MDQAKIGEYLKTLRKDKGITQEELAGIIGVSRRTVSRWETGSNMPDLDIIIILSDYYDVDIRDILRCDKTDSGKSAVSAETAILSAEYDNARHEKELKRQRIMFLITALVFLIFFIMDYFSLSEILFPGSRSIIVRAIKCIVFGCTEGMLLRGAIVANTKGLTACEMRRDMLRRIKETSLSHTEK